MVDFTLYSNKAKTFFIYNSYKVCYTHYRNYLRLEDGTTTYSPKQSNDFDTQTRFMADAPSVMIGGKIKYKYFYAEAGYNISKGRITYDKFIKKSLQNNDATIEMRPKVTFNSFDIQVGISLPFGK
jgi:hypothetical protein